MTVEKVIDVWLPALAAAMERAFGSKPAVARTATPAESASQTWWKQSLPCAPGAILWVGAGESEIAGIVGRSLPPSLGLLCENLVPTDSLAASTIVAVEIRFSGSDPFSVSLGFSQELVDALASDGSSVSGHNSDTLDLLLDVELPLTVSFGRTRMPLGKVLDLAAGSVLEMNRFAEDPVDVVVNGRVVARGEVVEVRGSYGVRITEIASRRERMESGSIPLGAVHAAQASPLTRVQ